MCRISEKSVDVPNDDAVFKLLFLPIRNAKVNWKTSDRLDTHARSARHFFRRTCPLETSTYTENLTLPFIH
jgi:hypothetical protein